MENGNWEMVRARATANATATAKAKATAKAGLAGAFAFAVAFASTSYQLPVSIFRFSANCQMRFLMFLQPLFEIMNILSALLETGIGQDALLQRHVGLDAIDHHF